MGRTSSYLLQQNNLEGEVLGMFRFLLFGIALVLVFFTFDVLLPKLKSEIRKNRRLKRRLKKEENFKNKMKELEIL